MSKHCRLLAMTLVLLVAINLIVVPASAVKTTATSRCSPEQEQYVWDYFMDLIKSPQAVAGVVGNLYYESHLLCGNLEVFGGNAPVFKDKTYAQAVDAGTYKEFTTDGIGFGLAQWTFPARKQKLLDLAKKRKSSVGSLDVQLEMVALELEQYNMLSRLRATDEVDFASDYFMIHYENPGDKSEEMKKERREIARLFYQKYGLGDYEAMITDAQARVVSVAKNSDEHKIKALPGYCQAWCADVYKAAGFKLDTSRSAAESANRHAVSDDLSKVPVGAAVYGHSNSEFGHVGLYIGDGKIMHIAGKLVTEDLDDWIKTYDGFSWGWIGGADLSVQP